MYYWNEDNFKGLKEIGEKYSIQNGYEDFSKYCLLKEKGLRKQAHKAVEDFISLTRSKNIDEQREIAKELAFLSYYNKEVHQLIPQQLHQFLITILKEWTKKKTGDVTPYRWLGYFCNNLDYYEEAIRICPADEISLIELVKGKLNNVDYQTHHLSETMFIGNIENARASLEYAYNAIKKLKSGTLKDSLCDGYNYYKKLIDAWEEYIKEKREISFPKWCKTRGENFNFGIIVYYNK